MLMVFCRVVDFHIVTSIELFPVAQAQVMARHHDTLVLFNISCTNDGRHQSKQRFGSG